MRLDKGLTASRLIRRRPAANKVEVRVMADKVGRADAAMYREAL